MHRRLREMGARRGREALSLREAHEAIKDKDGRAPVSYETTRQLFTGEHSGKISETTVDGLATMFDVAVSEITDAAGQRRRLGKFNLPRRADRLDDRERKVIVAVVDAILDAGETAQKPTRMVRRGTGKVAHLPASDHSVDAALSNIEDPGLREMVARWREDLERSDVDPQTRAQVLAAIEGTR